MFHGREDCVGGYNGWRTIFHVNRGVQSRESESKRGPKWPKMGKYINTIYSYFSTGYNIARDHSMAMQKIDIGRAKHICANKGLHPGKVKGTTGIQFTKGSNSRLDVIGWEEFESILRQRGLAIYESGGWMKIMKA